MRRRFCGFTVIELLVVITVITLLISMLLPTLSTAKEVARRMICSANLRGIGIAMNNYAQDHNNYITVQWQPWDAYKCYDTRTVDYDQSSSTGLYGYNGPGVLFRDRYIGGDAGKDGVWGPNIDKFFYCPSMPDNTRCSWVGGRGSLDPDATGLYNRSSSYNYLPLSRDLTPDYGTVNGNTVDLGTRTHQNNKLDSVPSKWSIMSDPWCYPYSDKLGGPLNQLPHGLTYLNALHVDASAGPYHGDYVAQTLSFNNALIPNATVLYGKFDNER